MSYSLSQTHYPEYIVKWTSLPWEQRQAFALRRRVFCEEQSLFDQHDKDDVDERAQLLVAIGAIAGWHDQVVGTVRIHQEVPGIWHGSRLAVEAAFRKQGSLGSTLIKLAVSSAHARGCQHFFATVQQQNEKLFKRLHWQRIGEQVIHGKQHVIMEADLDYYPPHHTPYSGMVVRGDNPLASHELAPDYFRMRTPFGASISSAPASASQP